jgi:hypothetical protein
MRPHDLHSLWRERSVWLIVIAALSTSLLWLAVVCVLALSHAAGNAPQAFAVARALALAIGAVGARVWPALALVALGAMVLAFVIRGPAQVRREVRHE